MRLLNYLLIAGFIALLPFVVKANTWIGQGQTNSWFDPMNWSDNTVPGAGDVAVIGNGFQASLSSPVTVGTLVLDNSGVIGTGSITVTASFSFDSILLQVPVTLLQGGSGLLTGFFGLGADLTSYGEVTASAYMTVFAHDFVNYGTFNFPAPYSVGVYYSPARFLNHGLLKKPALPAGTYNFNIQIINYTDGDVSVDGDELHVGGDIQNYGDISISNGATLYSHQTNAFDGSTVSGGGLYKIYGNGFYAQNSSPIYITVAASELNANGIIGTGTVHFTQHFTQISGGLQTPVIFDAGSVVDVNPGGNPGINVTATNYGTMNFNANYTMSYGGLNNYGQVFLNGAYTMGIYAATSGIFNYGTITKPVSANGTFHMNLPLHNEAGGLLLVQKDELNLASSLYNSGNVVVASGAYLRTHTTLTYDGSTITGGGTLILNNAGIQANNSAPLTIDIAELELNAQNIGGTGPIVLTQHLNWIDGTMATQVTFAAGSVIDVNPSGGHGITGTTINNGTMNVNSNMTFSYGHLENYGLMLLNGPYTIGIYAGTPGIFNHGTVKKPIGSAGTYTMGVPLINYADGTVIVESGDLLVSSNLEITGAVSVSAGAMIRGHNTTIFDGASITGAGLFRVFYNGLTASNINPVTISIAEVEAASNFGGTGHLIFTGHFTWESASLNCQITIGAGAVMDLTTGGNHGVGGTLNVQGILNGDKTFYVNGALNNSGVINLNVTGTYGGGGTLNNTGLLKKNPTASDVVMTMNLHNTNGVVQCLSDNFYLQGDFVNAGGVEVSAGANMQSTGYGNSIETGAAFSGDGTFTLESGMSVNANITVLVETFVLGPNASGFSGTGELTFENTLDWQGGLIQNTVIIASGATMNITGNVYGRKIYGTLSNNGTVNCGGDVELDFAGVVNNNAAFNLTGGANFGAFYNYYNAGQFNNAGVLTKSSADYLYFSAVLNNVAGGSLSVDAGTMEVGQLDNAGSVFVATDAFLVIKNGSNLAGGTVGGTGTVRLVYNGWYLTSPLTVGTFTLEIDANLVGDPGVTLEVQGTVNWLSGNLSVPTNIAAGGVMNITGYPYRVLEAPLTNVGTVYLSTGVSVAADVSNSGNFIFNGDNGSLFAPGSQVFGNTGTIQMNSAYDSYMGVNTINNGTVDIQTATLHFSNELLNNVAITIATGAKLELSGVTNFSAGSAITANGSIEDNYELTLGSDLIFSGEMISINGDLIGPGTLTVNTAMDWTNGHIQTNVDIATGAILEIGGGGGGNSSKAFKAAKMSSSSSYGKILSATITNNGATTQSGSYDMDGGVFLNNGQIVTFSGGIYDGGNGGTFTSNGSWDVNYNLEFYVNSINNGTIHGEGNQLIFEPELENNGVVSPGFSPGLMVFAHNFENGSELQMEIESNAGPGYGHDYISANENILLGGTLTVTETGTPLNGNYVILHCDGSPTCISGTFSSVSLPNDYTLAYTDNEVIVTKGQPASVTPATSTICSGSMVTLTAENAESYAWSTGETTQSIEVYPYNTTTYYVTVTYAGGGGALGSAVVNVNPTPYAYVDPWYATLCVGETVTLTAYDSDNTYLWSTGETTQSIVVSPTTEVSYYVTVTAPGGCSATAGTTIYGTTNPATVPVITDMPASVCEYDGGFYLYTYQDGIYGEWSGPGVYYGYYYEPYGLSGPQILTFTPYPNQCALPAQWTLEVTAPVFYEDADGDGYGNPNVQYLSCNQPLGYVPDNTDCDDTNAAVNAGATEIENGIDDDCDGLVDENNLSTYYADTDADGYGDPYNSIQAASAPVGYVSDNTDCNDADAAVHPGAGELCNGLDDDCDGQVDEGVQSTFFADEDGDGFGDAFATILACSAPAGYVVDNTDCDDSNAMVFPGATEFCNGIDDDCDGQIDEGVQITFYADADADGYGDASNTVLACTAPSGFVANNTDCNDGNAAIYPGATELCNGIDDDCDGQTDEGVQLTFYADTDGDGFGNAIVSTLACSAPSGFVADNTDCNDADANVHPGALETCNGLDDDCDGLTDEGVQTIYYADADGDGYGNFANSMLACIQPVGFVSDNTDCNDANAIVFPGAVETCNGIDDDCDGLVDEGVQSSFFADADGDGFGDAAVTVMACTAPSGFVADNSDCNDANASVFPGATEVCNNIDDDCDGLIDEGVQTTFFADADADGFGDPALPVLACTAPNGFVSNNTDCNDANAAVYPGAVEMCNGLDDDCDGQVDEGVLMTFFADADGDGYGNAANSTLACTAPQGFVTDNTDCNDTDALINPGATELCNNLDDNCNGQIDEGVLLTFYADTDADGFGNGSVSVQACAAPLGFVADNTDCDDNNASVHPGATEICNDRDDNCDGQIDEGVQTTFYADADNDGYGNPAIFTLACNQPEGYVADNTDCNDVDGTINPGAVERCNNMDDDCDGQIDEGVQTVFYADTDFDGYGDPENSVQSCQPFEGYVANDDDCNDHNPNINPGAMEICNGIDDDCDGLVDEGVQTTFYADADGDGYGDSGNFTLACSTPEGYVLNHTDCNDANPAVHPGATETCNGVDDDCDGFIDEGVLITFYADADGDGYGNPNVTTQACTALAGFVPDNSDCDDGNAAVYPGAMEICNEIDDDCDGSIDEDVQTTFFLDADNDGYGDPASGILACSAPEGFVTDNSDCNDANPAVHPGAIEICNQIDDDCDGSVDEGVRQTFYADTDGDTYGDAGNSLQACSAPEGYVSNNTDCDDNNAAVHPGATEICNGADDNCDGSVDEGVQLTFFADIDGDGYGNPNNTTLACTAPIGYVANNTDCNDGNASVHPGAVEICNGIDDDCDGQTDEGVQSTFYADADGDGFGDPNNSTLACTTPAGYVGNNTDCNDSNASVHPGAVEICNGMDDDCDGLTDESSLAINLIAGTIQCNGGTTLLTANASGGTAPYLYKLYGGTYSPVNSFVVTAGAHTVTVRDANGCEVTGTITISQPAPIVINPVIVNNVNCNGGNTGSIDITVSGGIGNYTYNWSNNKHTQDLVNLGAGTYTVTVISGNGCTKTATATVNGKLKVVMSKTNTNCNGGSDGTATATVSGGTPAFSYTWSNGGNTATIGGLSVGDYTVTVTDSEGCTKTGQIHIGQPAAIQIFGQAEPVSCNGGADGTITMYVNNGTAPFTYLWSDGSTNEDRTGLGAGVYTVTATDALGCTKSKSFTVNQPTALTLSFAVDDATCSDEPNGEIKATVSGGIKYPNYDPCNGERYCFNWSNGATSRTIEALAAGVYGLTVTDANGCSITGSVTVSEPAPLQITAVQEELQPNGKYKLTITAAGGTSPYKYRRYPGPGFQNSNILTNVPAGNYLLIVRDHNWCADTVSVSVPGAANFTPGAGALNRMEELVEDGAEDIDTDQPFVVYPNPAVESFNVRINADYTNARLRVFKLQGELVLERDITAYEDILHIDINLWTPGLYFVEIRTDVERFVEKLSVAKR